MKSNNKFILALKRSPLLRILIFFILILFTSLFVNLVQKKTKHLPVIKNITPVIGVPGDTMTIKGSNFGSTRNFSSVEIAGSKITSNGYISWSDTEIRIELPVNVQDGLVFVQTSAGRSNPEFFANETSIPVAVGFNTEAIIPVITTIVPDKASVGTVITINGKNFGSVRGNSTVSFTANHEVTNTFESGLELNRENKKDYISASSFDFDYVYWSDSEIQVRVPDGADSGYVYILNDKGESNSFEFEVTFPYGKKKYLRPGTYSIQLSADIINNQQNQNTSLSLYMPRPVDSSFQEIVMMNECNPQPLIFDDPYNLIFHKSFENYYNKRENFLVGFVVKAYPVEANYKSKSDNKYDELSNLYITYTQPDALIQSNNIAVQEAVDEIIRDKKNPYDKAKSIYSYIIQNYKLLSDLRKSDAQVLDVLKTKEGDAYDLAMIFTTFCRAVNIPSVPVSGILIEKGSVSRVHWWSEIYFEKYGWFPVDVALACGMDFEPFMEIENRTDFYFGNMDSQHVSFSRGYHFIKPSVVNNKTVYRSRTYALQSMWEETGDADLNYSSLWNNPSVIGIY